MNWIPIDQFNFDTMMYQGRVIGLCILPENKGKYVTDGWVQEVVPGGGLWWEAGFEGILRVDEFLTHFIIVQDPQ